MENVYILAIESSCDDTSAALMCNNQVLSNVIASQKIHEKYGGVVPELASRAHQQNIIPVVDEALKIAGVKKENLNAIAFTKGPGLLGSLIVGTAFAKSLSMSLNVPLIEVNHMQAHILSHLIKTNSDGTENAIPEFPFLCLTVSGGHTQIVLVSNPNTFKLIGETNDDAAGEAFDKAAKILSFTYPGGPLIDKNAIGGNPHKYKFPRPFAPDYNFSFSGLKTSFLNFINKNAQKDSDFVVNEMPHICASIQHAVVDYLTVKLLLAADEFKIENIVIAGGVSANSYLRKYLAERCSEKKLSLFIPRFEYCTDNAAMIGITGYYKFLNGDFCELNVAPVSKYAL